MPPELLTGYKKVSQIGIGARSTITHVIKIIDGQSYALKRVVRRSAEDDRFIEQAEIEHDIATQMDHPSLRKSLEINRVKKWFKTQELLILMEYVSGETLERARPTDLEDVATIFDKIAEALAAMHEAGFVHADIKPNNILLTETGVKIIDFGQSCPIGHKKSRIQGTPDYIAPEQVQKMLLNEQTDIFSLGATLYWVLTNQTFATDLVQTPQGSHQLQGRSQSPKDIDENIPASLSALVMDCCASSPVDRPKSMQQFRSRLDVARTMWRKTLNDQIAQTKKEAGTPRSQDRANTNE